MVRVISEIIRNAIKAYYGNQSKGGTVMSKWACRACGYTYRGNNPPKKCPICHASAIYNTETEEPKPVNVTNNQTPKNTVGNTQSNRPIMQGVSVVAINVMSENEIASMVQQEVSKEIAKLNAQGKRVVNVSSGSAVKNVLGVKHHVILLWEKI